MKLNTINDMKKPVLLFIMLIATASMWSRPIHITTPSLSLVVNAEEGQAPQFVYFGQKLSEADLAALHTPTGGRMDIYPAFGLNPANEAALSVRHADGDITTVLQVSGYSQNDTLAVIHLSDPKHALKVDLNYLTRPSADVIEMWSTIRNEEKASVTLLSFASAMLPIRRGKVWQSHLYGTWADEAQVSQSPLEPGELIVTDNDGTRNSHGSHAEMMFSLDGKAQELSGDVIGAALCWSGPYRLRTVTDDTDWHYFFAGMEEKNSEYHLRRGETFATPHLAITFSKEGLSGASRNFHRWGRRYMLRHGSEPRRILLNSWEGVYFNITEPGMNRMMHDIADLGGELFVMDDGWFGTKYQRNTDNAALGDWMVDTKKLPHGLQALCDTAKANGLKFGIWLEPEMTNNKSLLYEKHPDWVLKPRSRDAVLGRGGTQLTLDMANPAVQDHVFNMVDTLLTRYPDIAYIKWDVNMGIQNAGSQYLSQADQSHFYIAYHRGLHRALDRIRAKYPNVTIQACASGGGRANWGTLPWFDEFWVSDNTDALQRVYMQWGTSYFFPAVAMASHIASNPNHQTFRQIPLKYRIDVAMSGRLGVEMQPSNMTAEERTLCKQAISEYKQIRPVVQQGDIYRLQSPFDHQGVASLMYVAQDKRQAVWYWWKLETMHGQHVPVVKMAGLDPDARYTVHELDRIDNKPLYCEGQTYSGRYLMDNGLVMPLEHDVDYNKRTAWASRVLWLKAE